MITPRRTRLVRVPDLHAFRSASVALSTSPDLEIARATAVVVPTRGAARQLRRTIEDRLLGASARAVLLPDIVTRDQLYETLQARLAKPVRRLDGFERDAIARAAARFAARESPPPFRLRPGLIAEVVRFYDQLRRQRQSIDRFEELLAESLQRDTDLDRGAARMLEQTRFLTATFREYDRRLIAIGGFDEHALRHHLLTAEAARPLRRAIVTVADWIADPHGLHAADFDLLTRLPGLEELDVVATDRLLASGFHQRLHDLLPDIEEIEFGAEGRRAPPVLAAPEGTERLVFEARDREEELVAIARRLKTDPPRSLDRVAVVFKRPLPYLYLARSVFASAGIPYETQDALPLAAEPYAAALDLLLEAASTQFTRESIVALLRSPHLDFARGRSATAPAGKATPRPGRAAIAALDRTLSDARYLGEADRLRGLDAEWRAAGPGPHADARPALDAALVAVAALEPLIEPRPMSRQLETLSGIFRRFGVDPGAAPRTVRAQATLLGLLDALAAACAEHEDPDVSVDDLAADVRRWLEDETFVPDSDTSGVQVVDAQAARYGDFDDVTIVGLIAGEWPEAPRRNIFYPAALLATLGWPPEQDRQGAATAAFVDLLASASRRTAVSTFTLDDEALVEASILADEIDRARLDIVRTLPPPPMRIFADEALSLEPAAIDALDGDPRGWAALRVARTPVDDPAFHGAVGPRGPRPLSVSSIERYLKCPFQFFAQHVLRLEEEPEDDEVMDPKRQGTFIHNVFEAFFREWQARGHRAIGPGDLGNARELFATIAETHLARLPEAEASIERTRLLGSPVAPGLGDVVFRMESERPIDVIERLLEYQLDGTFAFEGGNGPRPIALRGKADRIDLLADGTLRVIDYKLSSAPNKSKALQLPIYGLCAEERLDGHRGRRWTLGEAAYIAFRGGSAAKRVTPLFTARATREQVLASAQQRLVAAVDAIEAGTFPPTVEDVFICEYCSFTAVCRKDYVVEE